MRHGARNPFDGGGVNLNPRPVGRNVAARSVGSKRVGFDKVATRKNVRAIGETCKPVGDRRADMLFGY
jgi:hypothetical protein